jgi:hypothetical protein
MPAADEDSLHPASRLRDYVAWFMTGPRLRQRVQAGSDGNLLAIDIEWEGTPEDAQRGTGRAAVQLRFTNGMVTTPMYMIDGLQRQDAELVAAEVAGTSEPQSQRPSRSPSLRGVFRRRDSCPLCRHRLPRHDDPDLLAAQRNLDHFRLEAKRMGAAYVVPPATAQVVADGASTITSTGAADEGRRNRQIRAAAEERDDARRWRDERRRAARLRDPATMRALLTA